MTKGFGHGKMSKQVSRVPKGKEMYEFWKPKTRIKNSQIIYKSVLTLYIKILKFHILDILTSITNGFIDIDRYK